MCGSGGERGEGWGAVKGKGLERWRAAKGKSKGIGRDIGRRLYDWM